MKFTIAFILLFQLCLLESKEVLKYPFYITNPVSLEMWLHDNFEYEKEEKDIWKYPHQMIKDKKGDCEDFAFLSSAILTDLNIENRPMFLYQKSKNKGHAITAVKQDGSWSYMDNWKFEKRRYNSVQELITTEYENVTIMCEIHLPHLFGRCIVK